MITSAKTLPPPTTLSREEARAYLVGQLGLARFEKARGAAGVRAVLEKLRCIQLDPLDPLGTNADLVALARVEGIGKGDVYRHLYPGHAFEHFAKERCLLPASAFPHYRDEAARLTSDRPRTAGADPFSGESSGPCGPAPEGPSAPQAPWWRHGERIERLERLSLDVLEKVLAEVRERGPATPGELADHGRVVPLDWDGWKGTPKATSMALEVLWTRCQVVVAGRGEGPGTKRFDVPERALPEHAGAPGSGDFGRWALLERVEAAGLLCRAGGPLWSMLEAVRTSDLPDRLIEEGLIEEVRIEGASRRYLAPAGFRERSFPKLDTRMRLLGPLDPLLWDRKLVADVFGFDYVWEVYKPAAQRRWGWYVLPLLHRGRLVGRLEGRIADESLRIDRIWPEPGARLDDDALDAALDRHARACGIERFSRPSLR